MKSLDGNDSTSLNLFGALQPDRYTHKTIPVHRYRLFYMFKNAIDISHAAQK